MPDVSLIVPTRNRAHILRQSLPRLLQQERSRFAHEVIVVDDASEDDTGEVLRDCRRENLVVLKMERHQAIAAARNRAVAAARGAILLFLDDDCFVGRDFVARHADHHGNRPAVAVTGPIVEVDTIPEVDAPDVGRFRGWHRNPFPGGNVSVGRTLILAAGGFDESLSAYGWEDMELHRRLMALGIRREFARDASVFHYKPRSDRDDFIARLQCEQARGAMGANFYAKHPCLAVGFQTKQLSVFKAMDAGLDRLLDLDGAVEEALRTGKVPRPAAWRLLLRLHAEIAADGRFGNCQTDPGSIQ